MNGETAHNRGIHVVYSVSCYISPTVLLSIIKSGELEYVTIVNWITPDYNIPVSVLKQFSQLKYLNVMILSQRNNITDSQLNALALMNVEVILSPYISMFDTLSNIGIRQYLNAIYDDIPHDATDADIAFVDSMIKC
jgi:hypothetical protein